MGTRSGSVEAIALLLLPEWADLSEQQVRGRACVWCAVTLHNGSAVDLGSRRIRVLDGHLNTFPRACRTCMRAHITWTHWIRITTPGRLTGRCRWFRLLSCAGRTTSRNWWRSAAARPPKRKQRERHQPAVARRRQRLRPHAADSWQHHTHRQTESVARLLRPLHALWRLPAWRDAVRGSHKAAEGVAQAALVEEPSCRSACCCPRRA